MPPFILFFHHKNPSCNSARFPGCGGREDRQCRGAALGEDWLVWLPTPGLSWEAGFSWLGRDRGRVCLGTLAACLLSCLLRRRLFWACCLAFCLSYNKSPSWSGPGPPYNPELPVSNTFIKKVQMTCFSPCTLNRFPQVGLTEQHQAGCWRARELKGHLISGPSRHHWPVRARLSDRYQETCYP